MILEWSRGLGMAKRQDFQCNYVAHIRPELTRASSTRVKNLPGTSWKHRAIFHVLCIAIWMSASCTLDVCSRWRECRIMELMLWGTCRKIGAVCAQLQFHFSALSGSHFLIFCMMTASNTHISGRILYIAHWTFHANGASAG